MNVADFSFSLLWFHVSCFLTRSRTEVIWTRWRPPTWPLCLVPICCGPETSRRACSPSLGSTTSQSSSSSIRIWYSPSDGSKSDDDQGAKTDIIQDFVMCLDLFPPCDEGIRAKMAGQVGKEDCTCARNSVGLLSFCNQLLLILTDLILFRKYLWEKICIELSCFKLLIQSLSLLYR